MNALTTPMNMMRCFCACDAIDAPRTEITFAADYLDLPIRQDEKTLEGILKAAPAQLLVKFKNTNSLTSRIRDVLKSQIGEEMPTLNNVAPCCIFLRKLCVVVWLRKVKAIKGQRCLTS